MTLLITINWKSQYLWNPVCRVSQNSTKCQVHSIWLTPSQSQAMFTAEQGFQNQGVCLQVLPSLLSPLASSIFCSHPTFPTTKTSKPSFFDFSFLWNTTETLPTQASCFQIISNLYQQHPAQYSLQEETKLMYHPSIDSCNHDIHIADYAVW